MKLTSQWKEKMTFAATDGTHEVLMDTASPIGSDSALTPKQLVITGLMGCTAMDVVSLLKKHKQPLKSFKVEAEVEKSEAGKHPVVFTKAHLSFLFEGELDSSKVLESISLSQNKYCGVSAMLSKAFPITWSAHVNGQKIGQGHAHF